MRNEVGKGPAAYRAREWDAPERQFRRCLELRPGPALTAAHFRSWQILLQKSVEVGVER
jgi:hypothetical protein